MSKDNSSQAFPIPADNFAGGELFQSTPGMTLRQWYAGQAMKGYLASDKNNAYPTDLQRERLVKESFLMADEMIKASEE